MTKWRSYFDSGVLVKIYHAEAGSSEAVRLVTAEPIVPFPFLAEMELRNALRVLSGRGVISPEMLRKALAGVDDDVAAGRLRRLAYDPGELEATAEMLSRDFATATLCRTLDLLHVSLAKVAGASRFVTGDLRQAELARRARLGVHFLRPTD